MRRSFGIRHRTRSSLCRMQVQRLQEPVWPRAQLYRRSRSARSVRRSAGIRPAGMLLVRWMCRLSTLRCRWSIPMVSYRYLLRPADSQVGPITRGRFCLWAKDRVIRSPPRFIRSTRIRHTIQKVRFSYVFRKLIILVILDNYFGRQFNSLNDIAVNPRNKELYFTDPLYGYLQDFRPAPQLPTQVYRFNECTGAVTVVADGFGQPNGEQDPLLMY